MSIPEILTRSGAIEVGRFGRVAVVMGGWSAEREISLLSGNAVLAALREQGVDAHAVDADRDIIRQLGRGGYDRAFMILHGRGGEDGVVQAALELAGIPYTGSGVLASALAMDKVRAKEICQAAGVRTPAWRFVTSEQQVREAAEEFGYPVIVKPVSEGSSIGVSKARQNQISEAWELASRYGDVMVESFIDGREVTASVLVDQALPLISMKTSNLFYDYEAKYFSDDTEYECPCDLPEAVTKEIRAMVLQAFSAIGARHWARADFMLDQNQVPYFIEMNTAPGMTDHSLVPLAARQVGIGFGSLCLTILAQTMSQEHSGVAVSAETGKARSGVVA